MASEIVQSAIYKMGLDSGQYVQAANAVDSANDKMVSGIDQVAAAEERTVVTTQKVGNEFAKLEARADRLIAIEQRRRNAIEQATRVAAEEGIEAQRLAQYLTVLNAKYDQQAAALNRVRTPAAQSTAQFRQFGFVAQQAGYQLGDLAVQIGSGQGIFRPLLQQGTQILQIFGPIGSVIGAVGAVAGATAIGILGLGDATENAATDQEKFNDVLEETADLLDALHGKSERNRASLEAEVRNRIGKVDAEIEYRRKTLAELESLGQNGPQEFTAGLGSAFRYSQAGGSKEIEELQRQRNLLAAQLGLYDDGRSRLGQSNKEDYVGTAADLEKLNRAREREIELLQMSDSERAIASEVDSDLASMNLTRATATKEFVAALESSARAKQAQIDTNEALKKSEKEAEQAAKTAATEAKKNAKERLEDIEKTQKTFLDLRDKLDPQGAAERSFARDAGILNLGLNRGEFGEGPEALAAHAQAMDDLADSYANALDPLKKLTDAQDTQRKSLDAQIVTLGMDAEDRAAYMARVAAENKLIAEGADLLDARSQAYIGQEEALARAGVEYDRMASKIKAGQQIFEQFFDQSFDRIGAGITEAFATGQIEVAKLGDIGRAVISELIQMAIQLSVINPFKNWAFGQDNPTGDDLFAALGKGLGFFGSLFGGGLMADPNGAMLGRAGGGRVRAGETVWVGEAGPEPFTPDQDGMITPNWAATRGGERSASVVVNNNIRIEGGSGDSGQNQDMANRVSEQIERAVRRVVQEEIGDQQRTNGMLNQSAFSFGGG